MLIKVTNFCSRGCSHCFEDSTIKGTHMTEETFLKALDFTRRIERLVHAMGLPPTVLLSGGECTEHPDIVKFIEHVLNQGFFPLLITNGMWLQDKELREAILRPEWPHLMCQVTYDPRFYPPPGPPKIDDKRLFYVESLLGLTTLGRAARKKNMDPKGVPFKKAPPSFNFRSLTRSFGSVEKAILALRTRSAIGGAGQCTPAVSSDGDVVAGESRLCFKIGTVDSTDAELTKATTEMRCNACGLVDNLTMEQKRAINEATLFTPYEP